MAGLILQVVNNVNEQRRHLRRPRIFRDRTHPLDSYSDEEIRRYRLTRKLIMELTDTIGPDLEPSTNRSHAVPAMLHIFAALRYYATGTFQNVVGDNSGLHRSTISRIITKVTNRLCAERNRHIKFPTTRDDMQHIKARFYESASMPSVLGAVDGRSCITRYCIYPNE